MFGNVYNMLFCKCTDKETVTKFYTMKPLAVKRLRKMLDDMEKEGLVMSYDEHTEEDDSDWWKGK